MLLCKYLQDWFHADYCLKELIWVLSFGDFSCVCKFEFDLVNVITIGKNDIFSFSCTQEQLIKYKSYAQLRKETVFLPLHLPDTCCLHLLWIIQSLQLATRCYISTCMTTFTVILIAAKILFFHITELKQPKILQLCPGLYSVLNVSLNLHSSVFLCLYTWWWEDRMDGRGSFRLCLQDLICAIAAHLSRRRKMEGHAGKNERNAEV